MTRILPVLLLGLLFVTTSPGGEANTPGSDTRSALLASVNAEFLRIRPCGIETGPSRYQIDHLAVEDEWACLAGSARYQAASGPFVVKFIALLKWKCGCWDISSISFDADQATRRNFVGMRQVPSAILPRWIRWSR